jgi:NAD+ kinase
MNIILFSRKQVSHNPEQLQKMFAAIARLGLDYSINKDFAEIVETLTDIVVEPRNIFSDRVIARGEDVMVTYGGDGTLLEAVGLLPDYTIPVVGINCGRLGYLTVNNGDEIDQLMEDIAKGKLLFEQREMIEVRGEGIEHKTLALNEVAIQRHGASMIAVETLIDGNTIATYHGDGLVVATPTGSTAYSLSAGGPVVDPRCQCFVLSPIAPHNLTMRPVVVPNNTTIELRIKSRSGKAFFSVDNYTYTLCDGARIYVAIAKQRLILATPHNNTFYDTLREKMMWGVDRR